MKKLKISIILLLTFFIFCNFSLKNSGLYKIQYYEDKNELNSIETYFDGLVYLKNKNKIIKIFPNSYIEFTKTDNYILKEGAILFSDNNFRSKKICEKSDVDIKIFLDNQIGKAQFYRLRISSFIKNVKFDMKIDYINGEEIRSIAPKLHYITKNENYNIYGFFVPLNLYWEIEKYSISINIYRFKKLIGKIVTNNIVYDKKWLEEDQIISFDKRKSYEISKFDREKYLKEKEIRNKIWNENNPYKYFLNGFIYPVEDIKYITSEFGLIRIQKYHNGRIFSKSIHEGVDIANQKGTPIYAPADGLVRYAQLIEIYGNMIIIEHGFSLFTEYAHLDQIYVKPGQFVKKGELIGTVGNTGWSTGPHLHWGARIYGMLVDPRSFFLIEDILVF